VNGGKGFASLPAETVLAVIDHLGGDGHGFYNPSFLSWLGVPEALVESVTTTHKSDGSYKGSIFDAEGQVIEETHAVYSLSLYRRISDDLGLPGSTMMGRGFEARQLHGQIKDALSGVTP
jgi:hypothetical protein